MRVPLAIGLNLFIALLNLSRAYLKNCQCQTYAVKEKNTFTHKFGIIGRFEVINMYLSVVSSAKNTDT